MTKNLDLLKPDGVLGLLPNSTLLDLMLKQNIIEKRVFALSFDSSSGDSEIEFGGYEDFSNIGE